VDNSGVHFEIKGITGKELCTLLFHISSGKFETGVFKKSDFEAILYEVYDKFRTNTVVQSATSQMSNIGLPTAATAAPEQPPSETPEIEQIQRPSSSTT
jgi:hypothetical protein